MSAPSEPTVQPTEKGGSPPPSPPDRRADIEAKQVRIAGLLQELDCEALLILEPENFAWFTSGATARSVLNPAELPGLYLTAEGRHLLSSNVDSQRLFEEELDGLGFQLKEWAWQWGREPLVGYLSRGRKLAADRPCPDCKPAGDTLRRWRRFITDYELVCYRKLGQLVSHALEATCRAVTPKESEQEIAGHLSHRLTHRGAEVVSLEVAADGRTARYRRPNYTAVPVTRQCVLTATARQNGLYATASRSIHFGAADAASQREHDAACKVTATYIASSWPDTVPSEALAAGRRVCYVNRYEHEWRHCPPGFCTGRAAVEQLLTPQTTDLFQAGWALTWQAKIGGAVSCDTFVITPKGPLIVTAPAINWPQKRIRIQGANHHRPEVLKR